MKNAMKIAVAGVALAMLAVPVPASANDDARLRSLRENAVGDVEQHAQSYREERDAGGVLPRDFVQQPPLIPHAASGYQVTLNFNKCLDCHSWGRTRSTSATKISITHFRDRNGQELSSVSPSRYFCLQCHVSQTDAKPLVDNGFSRVPGLN